MYLTRTIRLPHCRWIVVSISPTNTLRDSQLVGCSRGSGGSAVPPVHCSTNCTTTPGSWWRYHGDGSGWHRSARRSWLGIWDDPDLDGKWQRGSEPWDRRAGMGRQAHWESFFGSLRRWGNTAVSRHLKSTLSINAQRARINYLPHLHHEESVVQLSKILWGLQ